MATGGVRWAGDPGAGRRGGTAGDRSTAADPFGVQPAVPADVPGRRGAALLVTSASIHIYYYNLIYKNIATIGNLFLVQIVASFILAVALVVTRHVLVVLASAGLMAGTIIGFILVRAGTLFGFHLPFTSGLAAFVLVVEIVAVVLLAATALIMIRPQAVR
jgi:hypothetical protein